MIRSLPVRRRRVVEWRTCRVWIVMVPTHATTLHLTIYILLQHAMVHTIRFVVVMRNLNSILSFRILAETTLGVRAKLVFGTAELTVTALGF